MSDARGASRLRLALARACAWGLLVAGWVGIGSFALQFAPSLHWGFGLVALWLLALGAAATVATRGGVGPRTRALALIAGAASVASGLLLLVHGAGLWALVIATLAWAALTALASGVVRSLRLAQPVAPAPPIAAASLGALVAGLALGDVGDVQALAVRLSLFVGSTALALLLLQRNTGEARRAPGCRAGLFDCSLPAWPAGAWRDTLQWPALLAGLAMLPMMAALPLAAGWCQAFAVPPQAMVLAHLAAMFGPVLVLRRWLSDWSLRTLAVACTVLLAGGAALVVWAPPPWDLLGLTVTHGAAWGLAWGGQLWAPARRGQRGASPLRAAAGYAALTLAFGIVVEQVGARGVAAVHVGLGLTAMLAWLVGAVAQRVRATPVAEAATGAVRPGHGHGA